MIAVFARAVSTALVVLVSACPLSAQEFDEDFSIWPADLRIRGTVIAGGGGAVDTAVEELFLKAAGTKPELVLLAQEIDDDSQKQWTERWEEAGSVSFHELATPAADPAALTEALGRANGVWLEQSLSGAGLVGVLGQGLDPLRALIARGGVLFANGGIVGSLGKIQITGALADFPGYPNIEHGSELVPDSVLLTGFDQPHSRDRLLSVLASHRRCVGIGIDSDAAIVLDGRKIRVAGQGKATFFLMANERMPLRVKQMEAHPSRRANPYQYLVDLTAWRREAIDRTLPPFPPSEPLPPHLEHGTLIIVGGGGMPSGLMQQMVDLAGGAEAKMVYVPCSERDVVAQRQRTVEMWKSMGVASATFIHTKDRHRANSDDGFLEPLKDATGIWFGGGRQWNFSDSYYGTEAHRLMKQVLQRGGVVGGSSAGASIQARYLARANPLANFDIMAPGYERGLGFISGVAIDQHFSQRGRQKDMTQLVNRHPQLLGIGIDEGTAIIVEKSIAQVVGKGKVHFYDRNLPVVPGQPDFIALEAGARFDLKDREIVEPEEGPKP